MPPIDPNMGGGGSFLGNLGQQQPAQADPMSLLQMAQQAMGGGENSYGGRTMRQVMQGGYGTENFDINNNPMSGDQAAIDWMNSPATNERVNAAITSGGKYQPDFARTLQSFGPEGGWFAIPGTQPESNVPWGLGGAGQAVNWGNNPAPGLMGLSTNNWRLLPKEYQSPRWTMRAGHIIDQRYADKPWQFQWEKGADAPWGLGGPGHGFPFSHGSSNQRGYFFPGQLEPEITEGGPGTT